MGSHHFILYLEGVTDVAHGLLEISHTSHKGITVCIYPNYVRKRTRKKSDVVLAMFVASMHAPTGNQNTAKVIADWPVAG